MHGDRVAIVFSAPSEISSFIKQSCPWCKRASPLEVSDENRAVCAGRDRSACADCICRRVPDARYYDARHDV